MAFFLLAAASAGRCAVRLESYDVGTAGIVRAGSWARFRVVLATDAEPFEGRASLSLGDGAMERSISMPPHGRLLWEGATSVGILPGEGSLRLDGDGGTRHAFPMPFSNTAGPGDFAIVAYTSTRGAAAAIADRPLSDWLADAGEVTGRFVVGETGAARELPAAWPGWSAVSAVVWKGVSPRDPRWTAAQEQAFLRWLRLGGNLICVEDGVVEGWASSFLAPLLPLLPARWDTRRAPAWLGVGSELRIHTGLLRPDAQSLLAVEGSVAVAARDVGLGRVVWVGVPWTGRTLRSEEMLWRTILRAVRIPPLGSWEMRTAAQRQRVLDRLSPLAGTERGVSQPLREFLVSAAVWFAAVVVFAVWCCWRRGSAGYLVIAMVCVLAGVGRAVWGGRVRTAAMRELGVLRVFPEAREGYWRGTLSLPPMAADRARVEFAVAPNAVPLDDSGGSAVWQEENENAPPDGALLSVAPRRRQGVHWEAQAFVPVPGSVRATRAVGRDGPVVAVSHTLPVDFERAAVLSGDAASFLGPLPSGRTASARTELVERRRAFWDRLGLPAPIFGLWAREGLLDALLPKAGDVFVGWASGVSVLGRVGTRTAENRLLVLMPLGITATDGPGPAAPGETVPAH